MTCRRTISYTQFCDGRDKMADQRKKVLVVDDNLGMLKMLMVNVARWGYQPVPATGPEDAMRIFESDPEIQLVISDHEMSPMTGIQMIACLRRTDRRFEAIIFTGGHTERLVATAAVFSIRKIIPKPDYQWLHEELIAAVTDLETNS